MPSRRSVLASVSLGLAGGLGGCPTLSDTDDESERSPTDRTSSPPPSAVEPTATVTDSEPPATEESLGNLPEECVTDEFTGFTGTTPVPVPERPGDPTPDAAVAYAREYERYYLAYRAMDDLGPQTPDGRTGLPAHDFPGVRLDESTAEVLRSGDDRVVVRLAYDRVFEGESRGEFTVVYAVSADRTVRAATDGRVAPGPDPLDDGYVQRC
ncbi:hypothetical protein [Halosimplex sp. TS25]|uniref:hypothetical protein n=1 Tax=Halosimplex rarum TaxID=3396619 RepID=UPI0039EAA8C3